MTITTTSDITSTVKPWSGFQYAPVRSLSDRLIARWLRTQRKNLRRNFLERGQLDLYQQLEDLRRNPRLGYMAKNRIFQRVMDEYIKRSAPQTTSVPVERPMDVQSPEPAAVEVPARGGTGPAVGVHGLASETGVVIDE